MIPIPTETPNETPIAVSDGSAVKPKSRPNKTARIDPTTIPIRPPTPLTVAASITN